jgi:hypothetical protein
VGLTDRSSRLAPGCDSLSERWQERPRSGVCDLDRRGLPNVGLVPSLVMIIGVISDTHELLRPEALTALRGSDRIIDANDVGAPEVHAALAELAPNDRGRAGPRRS